jgi:glycosyltransferase involved in cell wall biosynthesis
MQYPRITVFTPTYNRAYIIGILYESLKRQTYQNFEWIVIDDGSDDHTEELFNVWLKENTSFQITYLKVNNGGKHRAINKALDIAKGELFFIVDSDDQLVYKALEKVDRWADSIKQSKDKYAGISGNKGYSSNQIVGKTFDGEYIDATSLERVKYNILGDKAEVFYTHILREYKFPEFEGENFLTEAVVWNRIALDGYKIRWFNEIIYLCDYLEDGLTKAGMQIFYNSPKGYALYIKQQIQYYPYSIRQKISTYLHYYIGMQNKMTKNEICENLNISRTYLEMLVIIKKFRALLKGRL